MAKEQISFKIESNLDKIAKQAKNLSDNVNLLSNSFKKKNILLKQQNVLEEKSNKSVKELSQEYNQLTSNVKSFIGKGSELRRTYKNYENDVKSSTDSLKNFNNQINNTISNNYDKEIDKQTKKIRDIESSVTNTVMKVLDRIHEVGVQLTLEANNLKPFALDFMSAFTINPLKFFGAGQAMKDSFELIKMFQQMRHELAYLSDSSGNASKALSLVYEIAGGSAIASGTAQGVLRALADQGIIATRELKSIGILSGNLQAATGIAASQWASFTGELAFNYGIPVKGLENITSALIGTNLRGAQLEKVMGTVNKILQTTAFIAGKPTTESVHNLTKAVGASVKIFQAMGISAEKAGGFIEGMADPENFEKNALLFAKMGISASEYADMLNDVNGQQRLLQKTMENLPRVAEEIVNIRNPMARQQFAKTLGLDMQIVRNMAGKTQAEIQQMIVKYEAENRAAEALEAKKKAMAAEAAKFDDMMLGLRLKVLRPIMDFLVNQKGLENFINVLPTIAITIGRLFESMVPIIKVLTDAFNELVPLFADFVERFVAPFVRAFPMILEYLLNKLPFLDTRKGETGEESPAQKLFLVASNMLEYLAKIYLTVLAWKGLNFLGDTFTKIKGFFRPGQKRVVDATLDELAGAIRGDIGPGGSVLNMLGLGTRMVGGAALAGGLGYLLKAGYQRVTGEDESKLGIGDIRGGDVALAAGIKGSTFLLPKLLGGIGKEGYKNFLANKEALSYMMGSNLYSRGSKLSALAGTTRGLLRPLSMGYDAYRIASAETKQEEYGAYGSLIGGGLGAASIALAPLTGGTSLAVGAIVGVASSIVGEMIGRKYGASIDETLTPLNAVIKMQSEKISSSIGTGMTNIFNAFNLNRFDIVHEQISDMFDLMIDKILMKLSKKFMLGFLYENKDITDAQIKSIETLTSQYQGKISGITTSNLETFSGKEMSYMRTLTPAQLKELYKVGSIEEYKRNLKSQGETYFSQNIEKVKNEYKTKLQELGLSDDMISTQVKMLSMSAGSERIKMIDGLNQLIKTNEKTNDIGKKSLDINQEILNQSKQTNQNFADYIINSNIPSGRISVSGGLISQ